MKTITPEKFWALVIRLKNKKELGTVRACISPMRRSAVWDIIIPGSGSIYLLGKAGEYAQPCLPYTDSLGGPYESATRVHSFLIKEDKRMK